MYEIQETNNVYDIVDSGNNKTVGHTNNKKKATRIVQMLKTKGFKGKMPSFFLNEIINFDVKY
jgi:hypothetical protein|tara:strand:+ start:1177 stop:1365 length:189 start_codon:yes stop_codon:yes gene_type:complete